MIRTLGIRSLAALGLWLVVIGFVLLFDTVVGKPEGSLVYLLAGFWLVLLLSFVALKNKEKNRQTLADLAIVFSVVFFFWEGLTAKWDVLDSFVFPSPATVLSTIGQDKGEITDHIWASTKLLLTGYGLAVVAAISLGLYAGWNPRLHELIKPLASIASPIPPIVYIPYAITLLPSFFLSSVFVIFVGAFWPILINTLNGVVHIEHRLIDSARTLQLSPYTMFRRVLLPGALPGIFAGASIGLVFAFILLTAAELIGATAGLGYYVKYHTDFGDFARVIVGIILIGAYVTILMTLLQRFERYCLRWKQR
ncbi:ABC transporter permease [Ammoniphilus sp. CFH 90114]|uniref:ABC transporter permease n=1 Tax=Ammoniphilus sp. CFH 90114 TaxID=2493665 RepID=UPI00100F5CCE|nr:ABC transporter permease [Ammoniphilus sp. CFH 90114]RXT07999.1 ABC transporter permease [Ammoniphilus sp. CFH 90114]